MKTKRFYYLKLNNKGYMFESLTEAKEVKDFLDDGSIIEQECYVINDLAVPANGFKIYIPKEAIMENIPEKLRKFLIRK